MGSVWQTVADHVKQEKHTVTSLYPNTVYLFIVRAVNSYGLSDPSPISEPVRTQGEDGRQDEPMESGDTCPLVLSWWAGVSAFVSVVSDGSPMEQGMDHRQVQRELGEVSVHLQKPIVLSPTSARISWTVSGEHLYLFCRRFCPKQPNCA